MYGVQSLLEFSHSGGALFSFNLFIIVASESSRTTVRSKSNIASEGILQKRALSTAAKHALSEVMGVGKS